MLVVSVAEGGNDILHWSPASFCDQADIFPISGAEHKGVEEDSGTARSDYTV